MENWLVPGLLGSVTAGTLVGQGFIRVATKHHQNRWLWMVIGWTIGSTIGLLATLGVMSVTSATGIANDKLLTELRLVTADVERELERVRRGDSHIAPERQLELMLQEFTFSEQGVMTGTLPPRQERQLVAAWYVGDSWPYEHELALRIMGLQELYKQVR